MNTTKACTYEGCNEPVNSPHDEDLCVFHAPVEKKGISVEEFNKKIFRKINKKDYNFTGFIFPGMISFGTNGKIFSDRLIIESNAKFYDSVFNEIVYFSNVEFVKSANFNNTTFLGQAEFIKTIFNQYASFHGSHFSDTADFGYAQLLGFTDFYYTKFDKAAPFYDNIIGPELRFSKLIFGSHSKFSFSRPKFSENDSKSNKVIFDNVLFAPYTTLFEGIKQKTNNMVILIFRFCQLKDVYFTDNDMSLFSFNKSSFDQARFSSNDWGFEQDKILFFPYKRNNVISEDSFLSKIFQHKDDEENVKKLQYEYGLTELHTYEDIAALYRQMKTALDNTKDYQQASWFYFNEFEMKRKSLEDEIESSEPKWKIFRWQPCMWLNHQRKKIFSRYLLFFLYKVLAGYGEKPLWSFWWFWFFSLVFSFIHLFTGLAVSVNNLGNTPYKISNILNDFQTLQFWKDFLDSFIYTVSRVLPVSYISTSPSECYSFTTLGKIVSVFNSIILIILLIFIGIGLKRHFRRF